MDNNGLKGLLAFGVLGLLQAVTLWIIAKTKALSQATDDRTKKQADEINEIRKKTDSSDSKLNSGHGLLLKSNAILLREKAERSGKLEDLAAADHIEKALADHEEMERVTAAKAKEASQK